MSISLSWQLEQTAPDYIFINLKSTSILVLQFKHDNFIFTNFANPEVLLAIFGMYYTFVCSPENNISVLGMISS